MTRPLSLAEVADRRAADPARPLWAALGEFLDGLYEADAAKREALAEEPAAPISREEGAYLAAAAEYLSELYGLVPPPWVIKPAYFLDLAYWPDSLGRATEAICLAESPTAFRRRFIFTEGRPLRRKSGPIGPAG